MRSNSVIQAIRRGGLRPERRLKYQYFRDNACLRSVSTQPGSFNRSHVVLDEKGFIDFSTLHELQEAACQAYPRNDLFGTHSSLSERFEYLSYGDYGTMVRQCRGLLQDLGINQYDKVGIIANNRWEWPVIAAAVYSLNATFVPMYEAQHPSDWRYIINDSGASIVFCATQDIYYKVQEEVLPSAPGLHASLCLDAQEGDAHAFATAMKNANDSTAGHHVVYPPSEGDLANLIYTSGTTGRPKGVELTHLNITSNIKAAGRKMVGDPHDLVSETDRSLAFLPWAHSYGQTCELWMGMSMGASMGICRGVPSILEDLQLVKPSILFAVPTLYKKVYDGVCNLMERPENATQGAMLKSAIGIGRANADLQQGLRGPFGPLEKIKFHLLDRLVLSKIRDRFGGNLKYGCVAGAACPPEVLRFMDSVGIPICEGYGLTETSPIITLNTPQKRSVGSVGQPIPDVTVYVIDEDGKSLPPGEEGEICCVGPNIMKGYHNNQEATDEVISVAPDGKSRMFHTGDLGRMDESNWLRVTGRIKEQYKLENGKYVVPTPIEIAIGMSRFVGQVVLCGANRPHNIALIVPEWAAIRKEFDLGVDVSDEELANDERVKSLIDGEIHDSCYKLKKFEVPTKWAFVAPFTAANNMLTPKMSIRRHKVMEAYEDLICHLYGDDPMVTEAADGARKAAA